MEGTVSTLLLGIMAFFLNIGLYLSLAAGVLLLLRPLLTRLLSPDQRVFLWGAVWLAGLAPTWLGLLGKVPVPISLRQLVTPRTCTDVWGNLPCFVPEMPTAGTHHLALPGGLVFPLTLSGWMVAGLAALGLVYLAAALAQAFWADWRVRRLTRSGRELDAQGYERLGLEPGGELRIVLCPGLPGGFVVRHLGWHEIFLRQELPPEQMELVLLHEREHVRRHHPWLQGLATTVWALYFWSPLLWLAYDRFRLDMELACDGGVLSRLDQEGRRNYARTLVELASGRPLWGGLTSFGECAAAVRVKKAAEWRPAPRGVRRVVCWAGAAALALFLVAGAPANRVLREDVLLEMEQLDVWGVAVQQLEWSGDTVFYFKGDRSFASVKFQDGDGTWQQIFYRRKDIPPYGIEVHCKKGVSAPEPGEYQVLLPGG